MFSSKIYSFSYTKNRSKEFYSRCYVAKLFLYFSFFIFPPFQFLSCISYHMKNFVIFKVARIFLVILFSFVKRTLYNSWKSHYWQLQLPMMIFNKNTLWIFLASPTQRKTLSFVSRLVFNDCLKNSVRNYFSFAFISNYW